ncbi:chlorophyllase/cutinase-like alpha/beta fold protein, partial [Pseudomonas aeruginosa]
MRFRTLYLVLCGLLLGHAATAAEPPTAPTPPTQPAEGPGGAAYRHASVHQWHFGEGAREYWVFTPEQPVPGNAPLVIFLHGWSVMQPDLYRAWIDHIVRRGMVVVYPRYQPDLKTPNADFLDNAAGALGDALRRLQAGELGVRPRLNQVAYLGHSAGGLLAANLAAASERLKLPAAKALMVVEPGKSQGKRWDGVAQERLSGLAKGTLLLAVCGDEDSHVACTDAKRIYRQSRHIPPSDKNLLLLRSDRHGAPP